MLAALFLLVIRVAATFPADLSALYFAGHLFDLGRLDIIYDAPETFFGGSPPLWHPYIVQQGLSDEFVTPYVYPPLWARLLAPVAGNMSAQSFFYIAAALQIPMLGLSPFLAWRIVNRQDSEIGIWLIISAALLYSSQIVAFAVDLLQPQIVVAFLTLWAFERYQRGYSLAAGSLLGVAAMLKLAPIVLALIFLLDKNWRSLVALLISCVAIAAVSFFAIGVDLHTEFFEAVNKVSGTVYLSASNWSVVPLLTALFGSLGPDQVPDFAVKNILLSGEAAGIASLVCKVVFFLLVGWSVWRSGQRAPAESLVLRLLSLSLLLGLFGPLGWIHYYLLPMFLLPGLPTLMRPVWGYVLLFIVGAVTSRWAFWWLFDLVPGDLLLVSVQIGVLTLLFVAVNVASPKW